MSRNSNTYFSQSPARVDMPRSTIMRNQKHITTFSTGELIPFYIDEVLPGDTHSIDTAAVVRLQTLLNPIMDNLFLDTYYFFVPNRIVWDHWQEFCGENKTDPWVQEVEYTIPQCYAEGGFPAKSIADYMGVPTQKSGVGVNALPFRAYALIVNEFFRDQNLQYACNVPTNDSDVTLSSADEDMTGNPANYDFINATARGGRPWIVAKTHDYFTSCLPAPQKTAEPIAINLGQALVPGETNVPVRGNGNAIGFDYGDSNSKFAVISSSSSSNTAKATTFDSSATVLAGAATQGGNFSNPHALGLDRGVNSNIYADLSEFADATIITINQLRQAFQVQKFYEKQAISGSRYREILKSMFGVTSPDARLQIPEYLGGKRIPIAIQQIVQTSETGDTPQGNTAAMSVTSDYQNSFTKSFVEHGYIIGLAVARYDHTYQQGLEKMWSRKSRLDFYWPVFANLGYSAVKKGEIFLQPYTSTADPDPNDEVFGYQEAWAEYRYKPNRTSAEMRSTYDYSLDSWHLGDDYEEAPSLSADWIREDGGTVDRVIAVSQRLADQFFADFYVKNRTTRPMPVYSVPGLIDHH